MTNPLYWNSKLTGIGSVKRLILLVNDCDYKDVNFHVHPVQDGVMLQVGANVVDNETDREKYMAGRKWFIPFDSPEADVVRTVFLAVMVWEEHETREKFTYKGRAVFTPHFKLET